MSRDVLVRPATATDLPAIFALANTTPGAPHWTESQYAGLLTHDGASPTRHFLLVAQQATALTGFCVASVVSDEAELENIVVASSFRRLGIGKALCREVISSARATGAQQMILEVRASNSAAIALYRSLGFEETGRRRAYYQHPTEDALLMRAALALPTRLQ